MQSSTPVPARLSTEKHTHLNEKQYPSQSEARHAICQELRANTRARLHSYVHVPLVEHALTEKPALKLMPRHTGIVGRKVQRMQKGC